MKRSKPEHDTKAFEDALAAEQKRTTACGSS